MAIAGHNVSIVTLKESDSPFYLLGQLLVTIVPGVDIITDLKDTILNGLQGDWFQMFLSAAGILPVVGSFGDAAQVVKIAKKWVDLFSGKIDEALGLLTDTLFKYLPGSVSVKLAGVFTDAPLKKFADSGVPPHQLINHMDDLDRSMVSSLRASGASLDDIWTLVKHDVDLATAKRFDRKGIASVDDMAFYTEKGVHPRVVKRLRKGVRGHGALSPRQTKILVAGASGSGFVLSNYGRARAYCSWQEKRGFSNGTVKQACSTVTQPVKSVT